MISQQNYYVKYIEKKVKKNKRGIKKFSFKEATKINQSYFYNLWIESFEKEKYK